MRERAIIAALILLPFLLITVVVFHSRFSRSPEVTEVRARVLPTGWILPITHLADLDRDGNDEIIVMVEPQGWMKFSKRSNQKVIAVSMKNGKFVIYHVPIAILNLSWFEAPVRGQWLTGLTEKREIVVVERTPEGKWRESLLPTGRIKRFLIADFDGNGFVDDIVAITSAGKFLWFQRLPNGQFQKRGEIAIQFRFGWVAENISDVSNCTAFLWRWTGKSHNLLPIFLWEGRLQVGQLDERVAVFKGDWISSGRESKILVRFLKGGEKLHWQIERSNLKGALSFKGWKLARAGATNKLGDGKWHLLVTMAKPNPLTVRVVDCSFEPSKGWQVREISKWEVKGKPSSTYSTSFSERLDYLELTFGDADGDGRNEIVVGYEWMLYRSGHGWKVLPLKSSKFQAGAVRTVEEFLPEVTEDGRLWFIRKVFGKPTIELGTFNAQGEWQLLGECKGRWLWQSSLHDLHDLNGDGFPELLAFEGLILEKPVLYYRSSEGHWRKKSFAGGSLGRLLEVWLRGVIDAFPAPVGSVHLVRWDGKNWLAIVWGDGFVQAVTLNR